MKKALLVLSFFFLCCTTLHLSAQTAAQLPYSCDFEDATENGNWTLVNENQTNQWFIGNATNNTTNGESSLYISDDNGVSNHYSNETSATYAFRDIMFPETTNDFQLSFFWKNEGEDVSWESVRVYIGEPQEVYGGLGSYTGAPLTNATLLGSFYGAGDSWNAENFLLENSEYAGQTLRLYFFFYSNDYFDYNPPAAIDDIYISEINCSSVDNLEVENITITSADIVITAEDAYDFIFHYKKSNDATWTEININSTPFTIEDLLPATEYICYAQVDCGNGEYGFPTDYLTFLTPCDIITSFPWTESFENEWIEQEPSDEATPFCWLNFANGNSWCYWQSEESAHSGSYCAGFYGGYESAGTYYAHNDWLVSPVLSLTGTQRLNFFIQKSESVYNDDIAVYIIDVNDGDISSFSSLQANATCIMQPYLATPSWEEIELPLSEYVGNYRIAFVRNNLVGGGWLYLDDITVSEQSDCPKVFNVTADILSTSSASINFNTNNSVGYGWDLVYEENVSGDFEPENASNTFFISDESLLPFSIEGLTVGVSYTFAVRQACGGEWSQPVTLTIPDFTSVMLPYSCDFEDESQLADWTFLNTPSSSYGFYVGDSTACTGEHSLYISDDEGFSNTYSGSGFSIAYVNVTFGDASQYTISFDWKMVGEGEGEWVYDYASVCLVPMNVDITPNDGGVNLWEHNYKLSNETFQQTNHTEWENITATVNGSDVNNTTKRLVFLWKSDEYVNNNPPVAIDNIVIEEASCTVPTNVAINNITAESATISWTANEDDNEWIIQLGQDGVWTSYDVFENPYTIDDLTGNTSYQVRVATLCNGTDTSAFLPATDFRTDCIALEISDLPYFEGFEGYQYGEFPNCWTRVIGYQDYDFVAPAIEDYEEAYSGSNSLIWISEDTPTMIASPRINVEISTLQVSFQLMSDGEEGNELEVGVMSDVNDISTFQAVTTITLLPEDYDYHEYTVYFNNANLTGEGYYIAFRHLPNSDYGYDLITMDDIEIQVIPSCPRPTDLTVTNTTASSVSLTWTEIGEATAWNILYGPVGFNIETGGTIMNVFNNTETIQNLDQIAYDFYVQADCGGEPSLWRGPIQAIPGFYNMHVTGIDTVSMCGGFIFDNGGSTGNYASNCNATLIINPDAPGMLVQLNGTYYVEEDFDYLYIYDGAGSYGTLLWSSANAAESGTITNLTSTTGPLTIVFTSDYNESYDGFAFEVSCVEASDCVQPTDFQANVSGQTAILSWNQPAGTANEWTLHYKKTSDATWTTVTVTTNPYTLSNLAANTEYEAYLVANCEGGATSNPTETIHLTTVGDGINDLVANDTKLFPNPTTNIITIQNNNVVMSSVDIYDVYGKLLNSISVNNNSVEINVSNLADGMYFARIMTDNGMITKSFIKK